MAGNLIESRPLYARNSTLTNTALYLFHIGPYKITRCFPHELYFADWSVFADRSRYPETIWTAAIHGQFWPSTGPLSGIAGRMLAERCKYISMLNNPEITCMFSLISIINPSCDTPHCIASVMWQMLDGWEVETKIGVCCVKSIRLHFTLLFEMI